MAVRIVETLEGVVVETITNNILYRCSRVKTAEVFCAVNNLDVILEHVKL